MDGAPACPFVAFGDDREGRSTSPDHRHRCFAESPPAPRAVAHQEAYCLSSAFPVCPTFQDWARREAAHARGAGERAETAPTAVAAAAPLDRHVVDGDSEPMGEARTGTPRRPPNRRSSATRRATGRHHRRGRRSRASASVAGVRRRRPTCWPAGQSRARVWPGARRTGSPAARSRRRPRGRRRPPGPLRRPEPPSSGADDDLAGLVQPKAAAAPPSRPPTRSPARRRPAPDAVRRSAPRVRPGDAIPGPPWERMRRYEAYPTIKTRAGLPGMPGLPRIGAVGGRARDRRARAVHAAGPAGHRRRRRIGEPESQRQPAGRHGQAVADRRRRRRRRRST